MTDQPMTDQPTRDETTATESEPGLQSADTGPETLPADTAAPDAAPAEPPAPDGHAASHPLAVYLLRHADAGDPMAWQGDDWDRPLSKKGRKQSKRLGSHLAGIGARPDVLVTSPKVRAAETATRVGKPLGVTVMTDDRLAGGFSERGFEDLVHELDPKAGSVMLVGHDPDFTALASWLAGGHVGLSKGAIARLDLADRAAIAAGCGDLRWLLPPDALR
jgi:phosphohistidine phosphatase